jgi:hypothetical protein
MRPRKLGGQQQEGEMTDARERYDFPTRGLLTKAERWMYPGGRPNGLARLLNRGWAIVHAAGLLPQHFVTLEVPGRRTGRMLSFPLVIGHERRILNRRSPQHRIDRTTGEGLDVVLACCDVALRREQRHVDAPRRRSSRAPGGCSPRRRPRA